MSGGLRARQYAIAGCDAQATRDRRDGPGPGSVLPGVGLHRELALLVAAGLTPTEALVAATSAAADAFRLAGRGRLRRGARADLVLVDGDPTATIGATRAIVAVWKDGRRVSRSIADRDTTPAGVAPAGDRHRER